MASVSVSVVIPVRLATPELAESLQATTYLPSPPLEVVVLPDQPINLSFPRLRVVTTGKATPASKRDLALQYVQGEIVAFLDDDAYPTKQWLPSALRHFADPAVAAVGGPAITPPDDGFWAQVSGAVLTSWWGSGPVQMRYWPVGEVRLVDDWPSVNLLVRRQVLQELGGFGTDTWPGEDTKLCLEIIHRGYRIVYDPQLVVYHHRATTPLKHLRQVARYGLHRGHFAKRYPATSRRLHYFLPSIGLLALLISAVAALRVPFIRPYLLASVWLWVIIAAWAGLREAWRMRRLMIAPFIPILLLATHLTYGFAFLRGLFSARLKHYQRIQR